MEKDHKVYTIEFVIKENSKYLNESTALEAIERLNKIGGSLSKYVDPLSIEYKKIPIGNNNDTNYHYSVQVIIP